MDRNSRGAVRARKEAAGEPVDRSLATLLSPGGRWNKLLDSTSTWGNGAELGRVSVKDYVRYEDSGTNWRLAEGYGRLFQTLAEGLPVARKRGVAGRSWRACDPARNRTGTVMASRVIVTVPTSIIAGEIIRFDPPLADKLAAAAGLPLGVDDKLFISLDGPLPGVEHDTYLVGSTTSPETMSYQVRPLDRPAIYCFFGGRFPRRRSSGRGRRRCFPLPPTSLPGSSATTFASGWHHSPRPPGCRIPGQEVRTPSPFPAMPTTAQCSPPRSMTVYFLPAKRARQISSRPPTAPG